MMVSGSKLQYMDEYDKKYTTKTLLKLNNKTDADIIEKLSSVGNKQGYVKELIRRDMNRRCKNCLFYERFNGLCSDYCSASCVHNGGFTETGYCSFFESKT